MSFKFDISNVTKGLAEREIKTKAALKVYGDTVGKKMEVHAKSNRKWTDQTGNARNGLQGGAESTGNGVRCKIQHGVYYGIYLEMCNERRYAILEPTVKAIAPEAIKGLANILK